MLLSVLAALSVFMTCTMFAIRQSMLGFPAAIFWAILGGHAYTQSTATWDIYYFVFFASLGMAIFSMYAAFALRERRDTIADDEMDEEGSGEPPPVDEAKNGENKPQRTDKRVELRERAKKRRAKLSWQHWEKRE